MVIGVQFRHAHARTQRRRECRSEPQCTSLLAALLALDAFAQALQEARKAAGIAGCGRLASRSGGGGGSGLASSGGLAGILVASPLLEPQPLMHRSVVLLQTAARACVTARRVRGPGGRMERHGVGVVGMAYDLMSASSCLGFGFFAGVVCLPERVPTIAKKLVRKVAARSGRPGKLGPKVTRGAPE